MSYRTYVAPKKCNIKLCHMYYMHSTIETPKHTQNGNKKKMRKKIEIAWHEKN